MTSCQHRPTDSFWFFVIAGILFLLALILVAAASGFVDITPAQTVRIIWAKISSNSTLIANMDPSLPMIILQVRLPRVLCAVAVGGGLAVSGVVFQGILHNPLADPYTLGVSSGAAFGASLALLLGLESLGSFSVPLFAFAGAAVTLVVVVRLASFGGRMRPDTMILAGVIVGAILAAGISLMKYMADERVSVLIFWLMGSLASRSWDQVIAAALAGLFGLILLIAYGRDLDIMACGDRSATALGIDASRTRRLLLIGATVVAAVCVSVSGIIGFIGLIIPHLMRSITGPGNRRLAVTSFLAGAVLLLGADTISRVLLPQEVPVGVLTALLGGPFFCYIFRRRLGKGWSG